MTYQRGKLIYKGKVNNLYEAADLQGVDIPTKLIIERTDGVTMKDGEVRDSIEHKGVYTNRISNTIFRHLNKRGVPTHFVRELSERETLIHRTTPFQLEVIVRNIATGSLCKRLPIAAGTELNPPLVELNYKDDAYHDPLINAQHAIILGAAESYEEIDKIEELALSANSILWHFFQRIGITLVDFKLEFGRKENGDIIIIDEISPDTCRLWDAATGQSLDKDIFRKGDGTDAASAAYREAFDRITSTE